jgi:hypothetical protein
MHPHDYTTFPSYHDISQVTSKKPLKYLKILSFTALFFYIAICWVIYRYQDDMLFHPQPRSESAVKEILATNPDFGEQSYTMSDSGSRYFCESLFWASQPNQAAKT